MNTAITIPKIEATPKPTKAQLIDALVKREAELWEEKQKSLKEKARELVDVIKTEAWIEYRKTTESDIEVELYTPHKEVRFAAYIKNTKLDAIFNELKEVSRNIYMFDKVAAKRTIAAKLAGAKKENPLLNNPQFNDALDSILTQIKGAPLAITTHEVETEVR